MLRTLLLATVVLAGCKGDRQKCEASCRNFATLTYWKANDPIINAAPEDKRAAMRMEKLADFENKLENGVETCVTQCVSANNETQTDCIIGAKTAETAKACISDD